ncbi:class I SAM-dependent methyltransferase [Robbsia sp. KACC 23696]|uniref:class I SAM-dependent DNA methyltransferase n=1 Tax=Robbsia sp. KACC 23696 TaxID=3149231 RepID=UPI00325A8E50
MAALSIHARETEQQPGFSERYFDACYANSPDPWKIEKGWYEERKRALLLASLPRQRYRQAYEPGCGTGVLTRALAARCDRVLASDTAQAALDIARAHPETPNHIGWQVMSLGKDWPDGRFDLIVLSELAYYLSDAALNEVIRRLKATLLPDATVVCCHWRHPFEGAPRVGIELHRHIDKLIGLPMLGEYLDTDFCLSLWTTSSESVAQSEALRT